MQIRCVDVGEIQVESSKDWWTTVGGWEGMNEIQTVTDWPVISVHQTQITSSINHNTSRISLFPFSLSDRQQTITKRDWLTCRWIFRHSVEQSRNKSWFYHQQWIDHLEKSIWKLQSIINQSMNTWIGIVQVTESTPDKSKTKQNKSSTRKEKSISMSSRPLNIDTLILPRRIAKLFPLDR